MIAAMLLSVGGIYVAMQRVGIAEHVLGQPAPSVTGGPVFKVDEILAEPARANLLGRNVAIWGVPVERVTGDWLFGIGDDADDAVPVVLLGEQTGRQPESRTDVRVGDVGAVFGTVHALRDLVLVDDRLAAHHDERDRLSSVQVYISALHVEHLPVRRLPAPPN
jgi:hypothetical protein